MKLQFFSHFFSSSKIVLATLLIIREEISPRTAAVEVANLNDPDFRGQRSLKRMTLICHSLQ